MTKNFNQRAMPDLIKQLTSLRQGITPYGAAPHKPVLLLAVIDGFRKGFLSSAEVGISMELMTSFRNIWDLLVDTKHVPNFAMPFFHLGSELSGIWELIPFTGKTIPVTKSNSIKSFRALRETVAFAALSDELFQALSIWGHLYSCKNVRLLIRLFLSQRSCRA